ncbi:MAG: glycerophosphodiester phosphodiesterase family protein [Anaerostipes sp.]|jgi:glycerophosphoryl diester phosphodiesterase
MILLLLIGLYLFFIYPGKKRSGDILNVHYFAHRGFHYVDGVPENSMTAFQRAKELGYGIELDVQLTKDKVLVVHHDYSLKRMCGVDIRIQDLTYKQLQEYSLGNTKERIPTFHEALELIDGKVPLLVELKMEHCNRILCEKAATELDQYHGLYCVECFYPYALYWFKKYRPEVIRGILSADFNRDKEEGNKFAYFMATHLVANFIIKPDFIAFKYKHKKGNLSLWICDKVFHTPVYGWTFRKESEYKKYKKDFYGFIFERFMI